jgi:hypothetical protein
MRGEEGRKPDRTKQRQREKENRRRERERRETKKATEKKDIRTNWYKILV